MMSQFIIDTMLGRLAKWLRVMGYDAHYQSCYKNDDLDKYINYERILLSRDRKTTQKYVDSFLIKSDHVGSQLKEIKENGFISERVTRGFQRCLVCNVLLEKIKLEQACEGIPEYVYNQIDKQIRFCKSCGKFYWPGTHKDRMLHQLKEWGFNTESP